MSFRGQVTSIFESRDPFPGCSTFQQMPKSDTPRSAWCKRRWLRWPLNTLKGAREGSQLLNVFRALCHAVLQKKDRGPKLHSSMYSLSDESLEYGSNTHLHTTLVDSLFQQCCAVSPRYRGRPGSRYSSDRECTSHTYVPADIHICPTSLQDWV